MSRYEALGMIVLVLSSSLGGAVVTDTADVDMSMDVDDSVLEGINADIQNHTENVSVEDPVAAVFGNVSIGTPNTDVDLSLTSESQSATIHNDAIDEDMESSAATGLCVAGLSSDESPVQMAFNGGSVTTEFDDDADTDAEAHPEAESAQDIVNKCT